MTFERRVHGTVKETHYGDVHLQKKEEHDSLCLSCGAGKNADDGGDGSDSSSGVYHV